MKKISKTQVFTKTMTSAIFPSMNEKYHNLRIILDKFNISFLDYTVSEALKVLLQIVRKQISISKNPFSVSHDLIS